MCGKPAKYANHFILDWRVMNFCKQLYLVSQEMVAIRSWDIWTAPNLFAAETSPSVLFYSLAILNF